MKLLTAFLLGSTFGVAAGLLMAPTSGKQARKKLSKKSRKLAKKLGGMMRGEEKLEHGPVARKTRKTSVTV